MTDHSDRKSVHLMFLCVLLAVGIVAAALLTRGSGPSKGQTPTGPQPAALQRSGFVDSIAGRDVQYCLNAHSVDIGPVPAGLSLHLDATRAAQAVGGGADGAAPSSTPPSLVVPVMVMHGINPVGTDAPGGSLHWMVRYTGLHGTTMVGAPGHEATVTVNSVLYFVDDASGHWDTALQGC